MSRPEYLYVGIDCKRCRACNKKLPTTMFVVDKRNIDGLYSYCRTCSNDLTKTWRGKNRDKIKEYNWKAKLKMTYDLCYERYEEICKQQEYSCAICNTHISKLKKRLCVDHDHKNGKVRGLLCSHCNTGIGMFKESFEIFNKAIQYLNKHNVSEDI